MLLAGGLQSSLRSADGALDPVDDRHVGQKNEQLVLAQPGQKMSIRLHAAKYLGFAQPLTSWFSRRRWPCCRDLLLQRQMKRSHVLTPATRPSVVLAGGGWTVAVRRPSLLFARRLFTMTAAEIAGTARYCSARRRSPVSRISSRGNQDRGDCGQVPADATPGQVFTFRILQQAGNMVTGGYTVNVVVI